MATKCCNVVHHSHLASKSKCGEELAERAAMHGSVIATPECTEAPSPKTTLNTWATNNSSTTRMQGGGNPTVVDLRDVEDGALKVIKI